MKRISALIIFLSVICIAASCIPSHAFADEEESLRKETEKLEKELEDAEAKYWKKRYDLIEIKKKAKDEITELENEYNDLMKIRSALKEDIVSLEVDNKALSEKNEDLNIRISDLYSSYLKIVDELRFFVKKNIPFTSDRDILSLEAIEKRIRNRDNIIRIADEISSFLNARIKDSGSIELKYGDIIPKDMVPEKGIKLRIGYIFNGYAAEDGGNAGILLHTGSVTKEAFRWHEDLPAEYMNMIRNAALSVNSKKEITFLPLDVMQSKAVGKSYSAQGSLFRGFIEWFRSGGIVMYAILFVMCYAVFIIIERIVIFRKNRGSTETVNELADFIEKKEFDKALEMCNKKNTPVSRMIKELLRDKKINRDEAGQKIQEIILQEIPMIQKHLPTLKSLAALAPLLGLLGTVTGMISLFDVITIFGNSDPKLLAGGIAEALVTTEFGLIIAIPVTLFHRILLNNAENIISDLERFSLSMLNIEWKSRKK